MKTLNSSPKPYIIFVGLLLIYSAAFAGKITRLTSYDGFDTAGEQITLEAMIETKNILNFWDSVGGLTVDFYVEGVKQGSAVSTSSGRNLEFTYTIPGKPSKHPFTWYAKFNGNTTYDPCQSSSSNIEFRAGEIISTSPSSFSGSSKVVTISVKNLGRDANNLIVKYSSIPSGWSVSPSSQQTIVATGTTNSTFFTFTVIPPIYNSNGNIVWELYYDDFTFNTKINTKSQSVTNTPVSVENISSDVPLSYALLQNYPNPFNPVTTISFSLPIKSFVSLKIFDALGREVATLVGEELSAGNHARQWKATNIPSGVYFYRMQSGTYIESKRLVLLR